MLAFDATTTPVVSETLQEKADRIAIENGVSTTTMHAIIDTETGGTWDPSRVNHETGDYGLVQINLRYSPDVTKEQALDPDFALNYLAKEIKAGHESRWVGCSCVQTAKALGVPLPKGDAEDLIPNSDYPHVGGVVKIKYGNVYHVAVIKKVTEKGLEVRGGNKVHCRITNDFIALNDPRILGYWYVE